MGYKGREFRFYLKRPIFIPDARFFALVVGEDICFLVYLSLFEKVFGLRLSVIIGN